MARRELGPARSPWHRPASTLQCACHRASTRKLKRSKADSIRLKSYPTFSVNKVTVTDKKSGRHVLDRMTQAFYAGHVYSVLLPDNDRVLHETLMGVMSGIIRPHDGNVTKREPAGARRSPWTSTGPGAAAVCGTRRHERRTQPGVCDGCLRAHVPQAEAGDRTRAAAQVHFDVDTPNAPVGKLDVVEQRRVAIARHRLRGRGADRRRAHGRAER